MCNAAKLRTITLTETTTDHGKSEEVESLPGPTKKAVLAHGFSKDVLNGVYTRSPNLMGGRPMFKA